jgi:hypothetical protein
MGQLMASIAHELKQPMGAARTGASAALRWLDKIPPAANQRCFYNLYVCREWEREGFD